MQSENPLLDQLAKLMTNAAGAAKSMRDEVGTVIKTQAERLVNDLDLVPREEFEAVKAIALKARTEVEVLRARLAGLESASASHAKTSPQRTVRPRTNPPIRKRSPKPTYRR